MKFQLDLLTAMPIKIGWSVNGEMLPTSASTIKYTLSSNNNTEQVQWRTLKTDRRPIGSSCVVIFREELELESDKDNDIITVLINKVDI